MIRHGQLRDYFVGAGVKRLSAVEAEPGRSNQHEINIREAMRDQFLGHEHTQKFPVVCTWLGQDQDYITVKGGTATYYDAREQQPDRSQEWRLYYPTNSVTDTMREGDTLFLALDKKGVLYFIVTPEASSSEQQLLWLFGLDSVKLSFDSRKFTRDEPELGYAQDWILNEIGIRLEELDADNLDTVVNDMINKYGEKYPTTKEFSDIVRCNIPEARTDDPDGTLMMWVDWGAALFQRFDEHIVGKRLLEGFVSEEGKPDVAGFYEYSLSANNRKKSRMGYSLENYLEAVFRAFDIKYVRGKVTENYHKPDFLFPDVETYRAAPDTGHSCLAMLGVKSTCKDRWRQVLAEASKIPRKHLLTLEPRISEQQTSQMESLNLQLVIPQPIRESYRSNQQDWIWNLAEFIQHVKDRSCKEK